MRIGNFKRNYKVYPSNLPLSACGAFKSAQMRFKSNLLKSSDGVFDRRQGCCKSLLAVEKP